MKLALRCIVSCAALLLSWSLPAQGTPKDTVDLAMIASINLPLDENCQATIIPSEILTGDFDVDGDGDVPPDDAFIIVVQDDDPTNGAIVDGCGAFVINVTVDPDRIAGFTVGWSNVNAEDKIAPEITGLPTAPVGPLYCTDVDAITTATLPATVSRCYTFDQQENAIVTSSLDPALAARLEAGGGYPTVTDNCSRFVEVCVNDLIERDALRPECNDVTLRRTFTATDGSCPNLGGNVETNPVAVDGYEIIFLRPDLDDLDQTNIEPVVSVGCDELDDLGLVFGELPAPRPEDLPFLPGPNGTTLPLGLGTAGTVCNLGVTFSDSPVVMTCDDAYKVVRTYTLIDWCNTGDVRTLQQVVKIGDFDAPVFSFPDGVRTFGTNGINQCGAFLRLDGAELSLNDRCSEVVTVAARIFLNRDLSSNPLGAYAVDLDDNQATLSELVPLGEHIVQYVYADDCGNADTTNLEIIVEDRTIPAANCENGLNVSLTSSLSPNGDLGSAVLLPEMIDGGSYDDCGAVSLAIGRVEQQADGTYALLQGATYGPSLSLNCEDLGEIPVGLRVRDEQGQDNFCWLNVLVEDKALPVCTAPADIRITCPEFREANFPDDIGLASEADLDLLFGRAFAVDNCEVTLQQAISGEIDNCGLGRFERTFTTVNGEPFLGNTVCNQTIDVIGLHDYTIELPGDDITFCGFSPDAGDLIVDQSDCDFITVQTTRDTFIGDSDECYKVRIEYLIVNWCEYSGIGLPYLLPRDFDGDNNLRENVFLHVLPNDNKTLDDDTAVLDNDNRPDNDSFTFTIGGEIADYGISDRRGAFRYYQFLKVEDQVPPEVVADDLDTCFPALGVNCTGTVEFAYEVSDDCSPADAVGSRAELDLDYAPFDVFSRDRFLLDTEVRQDDEGNFFVRLENVPTGEHAIRVRASDGCGNVTNRVISFCVTDQLAPLPICFNQMTVSLSPNGDGSGQAAFWATDAIASEVDDCSGEVTYSVYKTFETRNDDFAPAVNRDAIIFTCEDDLTVPIRVYAFDPAGRSNFCELFILVQRADNACVANGFLASVSGSITTFDGAGLEGVSVILTGGGTTADQLTMDDGSYGFEDLRSGEDYTVSTIFEDYVLHSQGVSTFDLVLITRYILGLDDFETPYQRLAADTNGDEEISVQDIIAARRLILGLDQTYRHGPGWRFVDENFVFPVASNPWATSYPEVLNYNDLDFVVRDGNLIAIMVGDVSGNRPGFVGNGGAVPRSTHRLYVEDGRLEAGQSRTITLTAGQLADLSGFQGTLSVADGITITEVTPGRIGAANLNLGYLERGLLPFSLATSGDLTADEPLLRLTLRAETATHLHDALALSDDLLRSEGYLGTTDLSALTLSFTAPAGPVVASLDQNLPNPAGAFTLVRFQLPSAVPAVLTLRDLAGRVVLRREIAAVSGPNAVELDLRSLRSGGVFTYTLTAGDFSATRKMVVR